MLSSRELDVIRDMEKERRKISSFLFAKYSMTYCSCSILHFISLVYELLMMSHIVKDEDY